MLRAVRVSLPLPDCRPLTTTHLVHRWLYVHAGIIHRDLSPNNIMCRFIEEEDAKGKKEWKVYGVLTDYDLSSLTVKMNSDYTKTSQQRTGTPPYMAHELLIGTSTPHMYRHDLESLFYIMLLMASRHTIETPKGEGKPRVVMQRSGGLPFRYWFDELSYNVLGSLKATFLLRMEPIELSPVFEDFLPWLEDLQQCFSTGFKLQPSCSNPVQLNWRPARQPANFDEETLGGHITYATILTAVPHLTGELKGLVIRDPEYSSVPVAQTDD